MVLDAIVRQLLHQPAVQTRNRKPMLPNPVATWELWVGNLRVYYEVEDEPDPVVYINAVGIKRRGRVEIAGEVVDL